MWETSVNSCGPRHPEWETSVKGKCGRRVWETSVNCKLMRPKAPEWQTSVKDKWKTGVNSCGPRHPEWDASPETEAKSCDPGMQPFERSKNPIQVNLFGEQVGDKCKIMRPKTPRVRDKCGRQVEDKCKLMRPKPPRVGDKCGRQV